MMTVSSRSPEGVNSSYSLQMRWIRSCGRDIRICEGNCQCTYVGPVNYMKEREAKVPVIKTSLLQGKAQLILKQADTAAKYICKAVCSCKNNSKDPRKYKTSKKILNISLKLTFPVPKSNYTYFLPILFF